MARTTLPPLQLESWRRYRNLTQAELAAKAGVVRRTIYTLEAEPSTNPHPKTMAKLAAALECEVSQLRESPWRNDHE